MKENPRRIHFVACLDPRTNSSRLCTWDGETERFVVFGMPPEDFAYNMYIDLPLDVKIFRAEEVPDDMPKDQGVTIICFKSQNTLKGL